MTLLMNKNENNYARNDDEDISARRITATNRVERENILGW